MKTLKLTLCLGITLLCCTAVQSQGFLKKVKEAANKALDKKTDNSTNQQTGNTNDNTNTNSPTNNTGRPTNKGGQGLISTPPNVKDNLTSAETSFKSSSYSDARYALQQAMLGVELEIGHEILKSLPNTVAGLAKDSASDQVTATGWGWAGLTIQRVYRTGDKQFTFTLANNSMWMAAVNMFLTNGAYAQSNSGQQNWKQTKLKGHRAVIEYSESSGYKLSVPLGQTSLLMFEGINFATEADMMKAAEQIDLEKIKKSLGEK